MPTKEELEHYRQLLLDMHPLEQTANQTLLTDPVKAQELYQQLYEQTNDLLLVQDFEFLLDLLKFRTHVCWGIGHAAFLQGNYDVAIWAFKTALLQIVPTPDVRHLGPLEGLGHTYLQLGQSDKAKTYYKREYDEANALRYWSDAVQARFQVAQCDYNLGDRDSFLSGLQEARNLADKGIQELQDKKQQIEIHESQFLVTLDPTGDALHQFKDEQLGNKMLKDNSTEDLITQYCQTVDQTVQQGKYALARGYLHDANKRIKKLAENLIVQLGFVANQLVQQGEYEVAELRLNEANTLAQEYCLPDSQWSVRLDQAGMYSDQGLLPEAIDCAVDAVKIARTLPAKMGKPLLEAALHRLISLRYGMGDPQQISKADEELAELKSMGNMTTVASLVAARVMTYYKQGQYEQALRAIEEIEKEEIELEIRRRLLTPKFVVLQSLGRLEEALQVNLQAIELYHQSLEAKTKPAISNWRDMLREVGSLYASTALLSSKLGRPREAMEWIDKAKAQILRAQLVQSGYKEDGAYQGLDAVTFPDIQALLSDDRAAIAIYALGHNGSSVYVYNAAQQESEPQRISLGFSVQDLQLPESPKDGYKWTDDPFKNLLPRLSEQLLYPLREVVNNCSVLCIVPDSIIAAIPFAALTCEDAEGVSRPLIEHCALAFVPAAAILRWCRQRTVEHFPHRCLAFGVGVAKEGQVQIEFVQQVEEIVALFDSSGWESRSLPEATTAHDFLEEAGHYPLVHVACHGIIDKNEPDSLLASWLQFSDKQQLVTAKDIFESHLEADLVFLNACLSGNFQSRLAHEVGGFWQAFLHAGTSSLIAPQIKVHPDYAQQVATRFYTEWLKGDVTKAQALRQAQLQMREQGVETVHWSHHILIGDYRQ